MLNSVFKLSFNYSKPKLLYMRLHLPTCFLLHILHSVGMSKTLDA